MGLPAGSRYSAHQSTAQLGDSAPEVRDGVKNAWGGDDDPLAGSVSRCDGADLARRLLYRVRVPGLQVLATVAHPQPPHDRPAAAEALHIAIGIEQSDAAAQHFPHLFKAGNRGLNIDFGERCAGMRAQAAEFVLHLLNHRRHEL